jgi:hypothetical protein
MPVKFVFRYLGVTSLIFPVSFLFAELTWKTVTSICIDEAFLPFLVLPFSLPSLLEIVYDSSQYCFAFRGESRDWSSLKSFECVWVLCLMAEFGGSS